MYGKLLILKNFQISMHIIQVPIASLAPESLNMIVAIVGANVSMQTYLKSMNRLAWVQTASHGANGFDNKDIYASEVKVTTVKDVYAEPISNFCIASYYTFFSYSYRRIIRGFRDFTPPPLLINHLNLNMISRL